MRGEEMTAGTNALHSGWRRAIFAGLAKGLPYLCFNRLRTALYRLAGVSVGAGTLIMGTLEIRGRGALSIGRWAQVTAPLFVDLGADVSVGDSVALGHHVRLLTTTHEIGSPEARCGVERCAPIVIEAGCWIGAGATVLAGVTIGRGSVVAAGAVVTEDVPENTLAGGVPARVLRSLEATSERVK